MLSNKENEKQNIKLEEELSWNLSGNNPTFCNLDNVV